jgi:hypothetical protein
VVKQPVAGLTGADPPFAFWRCIKVVLELLNAIIVHFFLLLPLI